MTWLLREDEVLASIEIATSKRDRVRGMFGRDDRRTALLCTPARSAHTFGVHYAVDVAYLDAELIVLSTTCLVPYRVGMQPRARAVLQAESGTFDRWTLRAGDRLEIRN